MSFFNNTQNRTGSTFFNNTNNQSATRGNSFFDRNAQNPPSNTNTTNSFFGNRTNENQRPAFNTPTYPTNPPNPPNTTHTYKPPGFFNSRQNPSVYVEGTMHAKYIQVKSMHKECEDSLQNCILFVDEYLPNSHSLLKKRAEDYRMLKMGNVPNDPELLAGIQHFIKCGHLSDKVIDGRLAQEILSSDFSNVRPQSHGGFVRNSSPNIGSNVGNNNMNQNSFFGRNQGGSTQPHMNTGQGQTTPGFNSNRPGTGFFNNNANPNSNVGSNTQSSFFNSKPNNTAPTGGSFFNNNKNSTQGSFFNNNNQTPQGNQSGQNQGGQGNTGNGFFNRNSTTNNAQNGQNGQNTQNSFFQRNQPNNSFFNSNTTNNNAPRGNSFFNNNNANTNTTNMNNTNDGSSFNNNNNSNANAQNQGFFNNTTNRPNSFFSNTNMNTNQQSQPNNNFFNNMQPQNHMMPPNNYMAPMPFYNMMPQPYIMPYCPFGYMPIIPTQSPIKTQISSNSELEKQLHLERELDKKYDVSVSLDFEKRIQEIERQAAIAQRIYDSARKEDSDKKMIRPLKVHRQPDIINTKNSKMKSIFNTSKDKSHNNSMSFTNGPSKNSNDDKIFDTTIERGNRVLPLSVTVKYLDEELIVEDIKTSKGRTVDDFKVFVFKKIPRHGHSVEHLMKSSVLSFDGVIAPGSKKLRDIKDIESCNVTLNIDLMANVKGSRISKVPIEEVDDDEYGSEYKESLCNEALLPKFTKKNYEIYPPMHKLARMSEEELRNIESFAVSNEFGRIEWLGSTDLTGVDIDLWVIIKKDGVEVYPEDIFNEETKDLQGTKLNKPAIITLYKTFPKSQRQTYNFEQQLQIICDKQDAQHISYDDQTGVWKFKVFHFTKYCFIDIDEDEEEDKEAEIQHRSFGEQKTVKMDIGDANKDTKLRHLTNLADEAFGDSNIYEEDSKANIRAMDHKGRDLPELNPAFDKHKEAENQNFNEFGRSKWIRTNIVENEQEPGFNTNKMSEIRLSMATLTSEFEDYKKNIKQELKKHKKPNYCSLDQTTVRDVQKVNGLLAGIPFANPNNLVVNDFNFGVDFRGVDQPFMISKSNGSNIHKSKQGFPSLILPRLYATALEKAFEKVTKPLSSVHDNELEAFYRFILSYYNNISKNIADPVDKNYLRLIELTLACFGLYNQDIKFIDNTDTDLFRKAIDEFNANKQNPHIESIRRRRSIFKWLDHHVNKTGLNLDASIVSEKADLDVSSILLKKLNLGTLNHASLLSGHNYTAENETLLEKFCTVMKNSQNETIEETFGKFTYKAKQNLEDDVESYFLNCMMILVKLDKFKSNISEIDFFDIFDNQSEKPAELQILYLITLKLLRLTNPQLEDNRKYIEKAKWSLNRCYESLLHTRSYFSALMIYHLGHMSYPQWAALMEQALNLHFMDRNAPKFSKKQNDTILAHYDKSKYRTLKLLKYYIEEDYSTAMKALCELGNIKQACALLVNKICKPLIVSARIDQTTISPLLERFCLIQKHVKLEENKTVIVLYSYLKLEEAAFKSALVAQKVLELVDRIFSGIRTLHNSIDATEFAENKQLLMAVALKTLEVVTGPEFDGQAQVVNQFISKISKKEYYLILETQVVDDLLKRFVDKLYK